MVSRQVVIHLGRNGAEVLDPGGLSSLSHPTYCLGPHVKNVTLNMDGGVIPIFFKL